MRHVTLRVFACFVARLSGISPQLPYFVIKLSIWSLNRQRLVAVRPFFGCALF